MKKVLFLQNKGKSYAGVWNVNKLIGENLLDKDYEVHIISIRDNQTDIKLEYDHRLVVDTINKKDIWESYHLIDIKNEIKKMHLINAIKMIISKIKYNNGLKKDVKKLQEYIYSYDPDYIITTHYQLLDMIPKDYLNRTIHEHHTSLNDNVCDKANIKTFDKYKNKIKFVWLSKSTMEKAINKGYLNSTYIYNAVKFNSQDRANVIENKKLVTIARLSKEKRIDLMIDIVEDIFKDKKYSDWKLEIYGNGDEKELLENKITNKKQIKLMGLTNNPQKVLLSSSINLNTSIYEGFSLSILEANECGIPTIAFNFGESSQEQILNNKTGLIVKNKEEYKEKLKELISNPNLLENMSINAKEFSNNFRIENIIDKWIELFNNIDIQ